MPYTSTFQVRFGDCDRAGIAYYPRIFHYIHVAMEDFFANRIGIPYHRLVNEERIGFPTVKSSTEFYKPLRFGDMIDIRVEIARVGRSSVSYVFSVFNKSTGELLTRTSEVKVAVNMDTWEKTELPPACRKVFDEEAAGYQSTADTLP
jgi:4-hydroxybenzoyl-CoA thioesterase